MEGQTSIKSLAEQNLRGIAAALDEFKDDEEYWRLLVDQLPRGTFRSWEVERFAAATLQDRSPSLLLLQEVQQRQLVSTVEELVIALDRIGCHRALNVLALKSEVVVTQHPSDCMVRQGGRIQLYCKAECKPHGPLYQWFISQGGVGQCLPLKGATDEQLLVQQADITHHGRYCCRCTNPYMGETEEGRVAFSNWAMVTVAGVPVILKEPDPIQAVPIGADLILSVHAECHPAPPEYRWFRVSGGKETLLEGHREAVLKFRICRFDDAGEYFCVVGNPLLSGKQEGWRSSRMTIVRVQPPVVEGEQLDHGLGEVEDEESDGEGRFSYGRGMQQPESQTNSEHGMDHLGNDMQRIGIARSPVSQQPSLCRPEDLPLRFSEDQQSVVGGQSTHNYPTGCAPAGHTTQPFPSIPGDALPTPATEEGSINFTLQPKDMSVLEKESFTVHCKAETGSGRLMYQLCEMKVNGECSPVASKTPREDIIVAEGLGGPNPEVTLFVRAFKESDNSVYLDSEHFKVQLKKAMFVAQPLGKVRGITGKDMMLMCRLATSDEHPPEIIYQWYKGESLDSNDFKYLKEQTSNILRLSNLSPNDVGYYGCKACVEGENPDMYYSKETYLTVGAEEDGEIVITEQPASVGEITVKCGGELKLYVCAMSEVGEPLQFVWHKNGAALSGGEETLEINPFTVADIGLYKCVVRATSSGKLVETNEVKVSCPDGEIVITEQPASVGEITVKCGGELKLHVRAVSEVGEPLQFVWHKNGDALPGGGETLEIKPFSAANIGLYKCVVRGTSSGKLVESNAVKVSCPADPERVLPHHKAEAYIKGKWRGKVAMLIANQNYNHSQKLQTAEKDVHILAAELRRLGFSVLTLANLTLREMQEAENIFCNRLLSKDATGVLAFVYFAGHGFVTKGDSFEYLMPVDAKQLDPKHNINRATFCGLLHSKSQFSKLFRVTDCCRAVVPGDNDIQSPKRAPSALEKEGDYYNLIDVKGCGYSRFAGESFLAKILQELMAIHSLTLQKLTSKIQEKAMKAGDQSAIQRPQLAANMNGQEEMKLSDEIDAKAYAKYVTNPEPDLECVENWKKLDPSGLPKGCVLSLSNAEWKEKAEVKLTIEEVFSNVLRVTVCVERKDAGTNDLTVSIDKEALTQRKQGEAEAIVCVDTETSARRNEHSVVVRDIQRLKSPLTLWIDVNDGAKRRIERLCYKPPVNPLYAALKLS